jgi:hypothetical protein
MSEHEASRTLVKSPPELWAELSDQSSLAGHLEEPFGEIRITRLEPETAVAWEGERASGTVRIEPSGWGTRVTLTARAVRVDPPEQAARPESPAPVPQPPAAARPRPAAATEASRRGFRGLLRGWRGPKPSPGAPAPAVDPSPAPPRAVAVVPEREEPQPVPTPTPAAVDPDAALAAVLDRLGAAHHRPFSRS